jgi:hypothetical protein
VYVWLVLATPLVAAAFSLVHMGRLVFIPYELGYGEGLVLWQSLHILSPGTVYHPISTYPFIVGMYPPIYLMTTHFVGAAIGDVQIGGRVVTLVAAVACAVMIAAIVLELLPSRLDRRARWTGALAAGALTLSISTVRQWAPSARVDLLGVALSVSGFYLFVNGRRPGWKWFAAFGCFGLAAFTKQSFVAAPAACLLLAAWDSRRSAVALLASYAVFIGAALWFMHAMTDGQFLTHLFVYTQNRFDIPGGIAMAGQNVLMMGPLLIVGCFAAGVAVRRPVGHDRHSVRTLQTALKNGRLRWGIACLVCYFAIAVVVSAAISGKNGAGPYYFIEWNIACCALVGVSIGLQLARWSSIKPLIRVVTALCVGGVAIVAAGFGSNEALRFTPGARALDRHRLSEFQAALQVVRDLPGPVVAYDLTLVLKAGKDPSFEPFIMYELLHAGRWNAAPLASELSQRRYSAFIGETELDQDLNMPPAMKNAILANYPIVKTVGRYRFHLRDSGNRIRETDSAVRAVQTQELP